MILSQSNAYFMQSVVRLYTLKRRFNFQLLNEKRENIYYNLPTFVFKTSYNPGFQGLQCFLDSVDGRYQRTLHLIFSSTLLSCKLISSKFFFNIFQILSTYIVVQMVVRKISDSLFGKSIHDINGYEKHIFLTIIGISEINLLILVSMASWN